MATIQAFQAIRYDLGHVGNLSNVVAPPYDVIDGALQDELYKKHPANVIRLILNRAEPGDQDQEIRYNRAARFLKNWQREHVLLRDSQPAVYFYQQKFSFQQHSFVRSGFLSRVRLEPFGTGRIYPHEETHAAAKSDRLKLTRACQANLSPIFGLYPDETNEVFQTLSEAVRMLTPLEATDHLGVVHSMWPVTDLTTINQVSALMHERPLFIADGHHRYETACNYRDERYASEKLPEDHPVNFVLMMCVGMSDPGMIVLPTHRLFRGLPSMSSEQLRDKLGGFFDCRAAGTGSQAAAPLWDELETQGEQGTIGFYTEQDKTWTAATVNPAGRQRMAQLAVEHSDQWQSLGVSILQRLVLDECLGATNLPKPMYVHSVDEVRQGIEQGDTVGRDATGQEGSGGKFPLVALVMPASLDDVRGISQHGERMPAKSTYFYPKLLSGLVINPLW